MEDLTGVAEMLGGRVKTLHPSVHGALLARRDNAGDQASLAEHGIEPIDLVIVNLYPFRHVAARRESSEGDVVEAIDIGGPAMVRAAAKNFAAVAVLVDPERYGFVLDELRESAGDLSLDTRRELAAEAFAHTAGYDIAIANWFSDTESFPERHLARAREGDRPRLRREPAPARRVLHGRRRPPPSALDGDPARRQAALLQQPARSRRRDHAGAASSRCRPA